MSQRIDRARLFAALGDPTRLQIVGELARGSSRTVGELTAGTQLTRQAVSKHLRVLQDVGLLRGVRQGREVRFRLTPQPISDAQIFLGEIAVQWGQALLRLRAFVEAEGDRDAERDRDSVGGRDG